jgi:ubiquinone/menaquinone biosynthesis C-methylase UbiE
MSESGYLPALRFRALTAVYDPVIRLFTREGAFKPRLLEQAGLAAGQRVLDLGCGTGTLAIMAKEREPGAELVGLDGDPEMIRRASAKAGDAGVQIEFDEGFSTELPYPDACFDRVVSTLFFHHLTTRDKERTAAEVARVLKPGGELHVADWGRPADPVMAALFMQVRLFDGWERTSANVAGALPSLFERQGLADARERGHLRTVSGTLAFYSARRI